MALKVSLEIANNSSSLCVQRRISVSGTLAIDTAEEEALELFRLSWERVVTPIQRGLGLIDDAADLLPEDDEDFELF
ncbi:hypothetical protein [Cloacibacillus sp.]